VTDDFTHTTLGRTGLRVHRLGLSATYRPGRDTVREALDFGLNYLFCYGFDTHLTSLIRGLPPSRRQQLVISTGAYNLLVGHLNLRRTLEKRLTQLGTDYIDVFLFLGVTKPKHLTDHVLEEFARFKQEGKIRAVGMSCHDRAFAGKLAAEGTLDVYMIRYNAAHQGAEEDIFPHLAAHDPGVVSYTATRWRYLIRRQRGWPKDKPIPSPGQCYRFVLSNPHVDVCLTAPANAGQLEQNLAALDDGPLTADERRLMNAYGDLVHTKKKLLG
jgi:aryl-alcohol dehydrogenase-like predicted oxidoreductase